MLLPGFDLRRISLAAIALLAIGCGPQDEIANYTVKKPELIDPSHAAASAEAKPQQMLGAIVVLDDAGWFFKVTGDPGQVEPQREAFLNFVKSVRFTTGAAPQPKWDLPAGWKELPGDDIRFATIQMPVEQVTLDLAITELPRKEDVSPEQFVLVNVNRWRGQVGLDPTDPAKLAKTSETFQVAGHDATFVSLVGESAGGGMGGAPFAPFAGGGASAPGSTPNVPVRPKSKTTAAGGDELAYDTPEGWKIGKSTGLSRAALVVSDGDKTVDITVTPLGPSTLLENVNRWRAQMKLPAIKQADLGKVVKKVETLGVTGDYVEIVGPTETILGVSALVGDTAWFIKLKGDSKLAERENANFQAFVKSLQLK